MKCDPVFQKEDGTWWFWNETWSDEYGPYPTEEKARAILEEYCRTELGY